VAHQSVDPNGNRSAGGQQVFNVKNIANGFVAAVAPGHT
jgi:hypothetical protein